MERGATAPLGNLTAVAMEVKGDTTIQAEGKANYWAAHNQTRTLDESTTSRSLLGHEYKSSTQHQDGGSRSALVTSIQSEGNILSDSTGDSTLQGTRLQSGGHVQLQSGASIHLQTADGQSYQTTWQERSNLIEEGGAKPVIHYHDHDETGSQSSSVDGVAIQGNSITLIAQTGDIDGKAIDFHAKNGIDLQAGGHILIDADDQSQHNWHTYENTSVTYSESKTDGRQHLAGVNHNTQDDKRTDSSTRVKASTLDAGAGQLTTFSGGDTVILGSDLKAQGGIDLHAQGKLILGGHQENQSQGDTTNTGTFIGKARDGHDYQDSATTSRASRLDSGGKIHLKGEEQLILGNVELTSVGKTHLDTPHLVVSPESQLNQHTTEDWDKDRGYRTERGQGKADESLVYGKINAGGGLQIDPGTHISVGIDTGKTGADGQAVQLSAPQYQRIAEQLGQQPGLGYLKDLAGRSDIDWQAVGTAHQQWDYKGQGMTQEGAIVLTIVIAIVTSGAGASAVGTEGAATTSIAADGAVATSATTTFGGTALSTTTTTVAADGAVATSTTYYAAGTALNAGFTSLATSAAISLANNGGDIGKALNELGKSDTIKSTAAAMITAGLLDAQIFGEADQARSLNQIANTNTVQGLGSVAKFDWNTLGQNVAGVAGRSTISAGVSSIIQGGDFEDNLRNNLINDFAAVGANAIGTKWGSGDNKNPFLQTAAHGVLGCAVAGARGGDCKSGAVGGIVESTLGNLVGNLPTDSNGNYSQLTRGLYTGAAVIAADVVSDQLHLKTTDAMSAAQNAATNNRLLEKQDIKNAKDLHATAKEKGKSFSLAEIEDALRYSNTDAGETAISNIVYNPDDPNGINELSSTDAFTGTLDDKMLPGHTNAKIPFQVNDQGGLIQNFGAGGITKPDAGLVDFIQANSQGYSWDASNITGWQPTSNDPRTAWTSDGEVRIWNPQLDVADHRYHGVSADNQYFNVPAAYCPPASCTNEGSIAWASTHQGDQVVLENYKDAVGRDVTKGVLTITSGALTSGAWALGTTGRVVLGSITGGTFDAIGQLTDPNNHDYRYWQTGIVAITGGAAAPFAGRSWWLDAGLGALTNGTNTAVTNRIYGREDSVIKSMELGAVFAAGGNKLGKRAEDYADAHLPAYLGGPAPNHNLAALLQPTPGYPNPVSPSYIGEFVSTTIAGTPTWGQAWFDLSSGSSTSNASAHTGTIDSNADSSDTEDNKQ